ncbi:DUF2487 family protein [Alkalibacillus haloalkaliphilus]|uniref:DUF2487 domain-containing protein n=1 Tax=Alkalibacillus haloalkaliphilus TaxID=94136 RepID=A0A511W228_9BACI|nr:DUF2487 family protein [Alkalibacillus haloalkaliphilus]MDV2580821.1 DUF2487 family protein [Alkalibacillus haloalkaliphilus]GEN45149.1 hypothetical protein AHA02nite_09250 [Alkalibacillus haloalkaliphilus]
MKWMHQDVQNYTKAKEYIDSAIMPLIPFSFENDDELSKLAYQHEVMQIFMTQIEKQLKGRVFLLPVYNYLKQNKLEDEYERLETVVNHVNEQPFKHIFLFTFDKKWRKYNSEIDAELIWLPAPQQGDLNQVETQQLVQSQVSEIEDLIKEQWGE